MNHRRIAAVIPLLVCVLTISCIIGLADGTEAGVDKPSGLGPYKVGFTKTTFSLEGYEDPANVTVFYPATSNGVDAPPDTTDAPYPTVLWYWTSELNTTYLAQLIETVTSHGIVMVIDYIGQHPEYRLEIGVPPELPQSALDYWTAMVDKVEALDADPSSVLNGMVDKEAYGISSLGSGTVNSVFSIKDGRCDAIAYLCSAWLNTDDYPEVTVPSHWQPAENISYTEIYEEFFKGWGYILAEGEKSEFTAKGSDYREGGYDLGALVAFYLCYLDGQDEYREVLYGEETVRGAARDEFELKFDAGGGDIFPPVEQTIDGPEGPVLMDSNVELSLNLTGHPIHQYPEFQVDWFVDGKSGVITSKVYVVNPKFTEPGNYKIAARWNLGGVSNYYNWTLPVFIDVVNMPPIAVGGPNGSFDHDSEVVFDASGSWDTASHNDLLEFRWSFPDGETDFSTEPTYRKTLTLLGQYVVVLTVRDPIGDTSTAQCVLTVNNVAPTVNAIGNADAEEDEVLSFTGQGTDTPSHVGLLEYQWDFGDGTKTEWMDEYYIDHAYTKRGTYDAVHWVRDPAGAMSNATVRISVANVPPDGGIDRPTNGDSRNTGSRLEFEGWGTDTHSDQPNLRYFWDFGDGATAEGPYALHRYADEDVYTITFTIEDDDGATKVITHDLKIETEKRAAIEDPIFLVAVFTLVTVMVLAAAATTEPGKYWFGLLGAPLFIKTKDVMDNNTRNALLGLITTNPGVHYSAIREEFGLANGAAAYHLHVLEREDFIKSVRDGNMKRFYAATAKVPRSQYFSPEELREELVRIITARPGISQRELIEEVGYSRDSVGYHLREMVKEGIITQVRDGKFTTYYPKQET